MFMISRCILVIANIDLKKERKIGMAALSYILGANLVSASIGIIWCLIIKPGEHFQIPPPTVLAIPASMLGESIDR